MYPILRAKDSARRSARDLRQPSVIAAAIAIRRAPFLCGPAGAPRRWSATLVIAVARAYFHRRIGGVTGDCLGAVCQISEILMLLIFVCPLFF